MARRCAEAFVRQNGYTEVRPSEDPLYWVAEPHERGRWQEILAARQGTLDERAESVICVRRECRVFFRTRGRPDECLLRAVTMNRVFADLHLLPGAVPSARCSRRA